MLPIPGHGGFDDFHDLLVGHELGDWIGWVGVLPVLAADEDRVSDALGHHGLEGARVDAVSTRDTAAEIPSRQVVFAHV